MGKRWQIAPPPGAEQLSQYPEIPPAILQLLWNRGLRDRVAIEGFLNPDWGSGTHSPWIFKNMPAAVARVFAGLERGEPIAVHGDYDADGVCGTALLISTLREICRQLDFDETKISYYVPHREKEGYGLSVATMENLHQTAALKLMITVDCGISNQAAIDRGSALGVETIVCDHHTLPEQLPKSAIILHPQAPGEDYPNKKLCGAGVAFKLASALIEEATRRGAAWPAGQEKWLLDLVAIATVTDVMPLMGENRVLEHFGLVVLNKTRRLGLQKLIAVAGSQAGAIDTTAIGYQLGPRLNAAGRMKHAQLAVELILAEDGERAGALAAELHATNSERQDVSGAMYEEALRLVPENFAGKIIIVHGEGWPAGLVGLVAGKLQSKFGVPVLAAGREGERFVGSGRSCGNFDITAALRLAEAHLDRFGGHPQACGFTVTGEDRFTKAMEILRAAAENFFAGQEPQPLTIDAELELEDANWDLLERLKRFAPHGEGNPPPVFAARGLQLINYSAMGRDQKHLRLTVASPRGKIHKLVGFNFGPRAGELRLGGRLDAAYGVAENVWQGRREIQYKLIDWQTLC